MWNPDQYHRYSNERSRPFFDLLSQVHASDAHRIADLGCGSGELTVTLSERWPTARVWGVDSSPEMIDRTATYTIPDRLTFEICDVTLWRAPRPLDIIFSNATFQWIPDHETLLPSLISMLAPKGILAFQVPGNFSAPSHTILAELRTSDRWNDRVGRGAVRALAVKSPEWYLSFLTNQNMNVTTWETTYLHVLQGEDAVMEWVKGTALHPVLAELHVEEQTEFLAEYRARLRTAYPQQSYGTVFPFRRIFVVAQKK